jgi:predicted O-methyltransferase YrrM
MFFEDAVDRFLLIAAREFGLSLPVAGTSWSAFDRLSTIISEKFRTETTSISPEMSAFLFAISQVSKRDGLVGVGTFQGYAFSWLLQDFFESDFTKWNYASAIDTSIDCCILAQKNLNYLNYGARLSIINADGLETLRQHQFPISLLYLDIDDPVSRKSGYADLFSSALPNIVSGGLVLAHDCAVDKFSEDFAKLKDRVVSSKLAKGYLELKFDDCGIAIAAIK